MRRLFGTDGIRGKANYHPMTPELALRLGKALGIYFGRRRAEPRIVIGKDPRRSSYIFEFAVSAGACSTGASVFHLGPLPTPAIAFLTVSMRALAGVVISASHNPFSDNGIKLFGPDGCKLPDNVEEELEAIIFDDELLSRFKPGDKALGRAYRIEDATGRYIGFAKEAFPHRLDLRSLKLVVDCANGAAYKVAPAIFEELGAEVIPLSIFPDGTNINQNCGALYPDTMANTVKKAGADLGIAFDGDADRVVMADEKGTVTNGDAIMTLLATRMKAENKLKKNAVVTTIMSNLAMEKALERHGITTVRTDKVGDRYVLEEMLRQGYNLGGEQSGHIILADHTTTGDGVITALKVLEYIVRENRPASELLHPFTPFPQVSRKLEVRTKPPIEKLQPLQQAIMQAEQTLGTQGRVVVRYSGTEPFLRIMVEGREAKTVKETAESLFDAAKKSFE